MKVELIDETGEGTKLSKEVSHIRAFLLVPENDKEKQLLKDLDKQAFLANDYIEEDVKGLILGSCIVATTDHTKYTVDKAPHKATFESCLSTEMLSENNKGCLLQKIISIFEKVAPEIFGIEFGLPFSLATIHPSIRLGAVGLGNATGFGLPPDEVWFLVGCTRAGMAIALESFDDLKEDELAGQKEIADHKVGWRVNKEGNIKSLMIEHWEGCNGVIGISVVGDIEKKKGTNQ